MLTVLDVILSLTRTSQVGYLRDIRRLTVALSRARLGLYVLGRRTVFESCFELRQAFDILLKRPNNLMLVTGELWPSNRILSEEEAKPVQGEVEMAGVEHLGQYVFEMTNSKVQQLRTQKGLPAAEISSSSAMEVIEEDMEVEYAGGEDDAFEEDEQEGFEAEEIV